MFGRKATRSSPTIASTNRETLLAREIANIISNSSGLHPLDVAARLTALFSAQKYDDSGIEFIRVRDIDHPTVCDLARVEGSPVGLSFTFFGTEGETGLIYLTTAFAQLARQGADPGPRIPAEMISRFVEDYGEAVRKLVDQRTPQRSSEERAQADRIRSKLSQFLG